MKNRNSNRIHPLQKFLFKPKDVAKEPNVQNKVQRPLSVKSVNNTCSSRDRAVCGVVDGGVATLSLSSSSKGAGPLSPSPSSWPGEPAAGGRQRSCSRMTTDKVVTPLQPSQRDHLDFLALSPCQIKTLPLLQNCRRVPVANVAELLLSCPPLPAMSRKPCPCKNEIRQLVAPCCGFCRTFAQDMFHGIFKEILQERVDGGDLFQ